MWKQHERYTEDVLCFRIHLNYYKIYVFQFHLYVKVNTKLIEAQEEVEELQRDLTNPEDWQRRQKTVKSLLEDLKHQHMLTAAEALGRLNMRNIYHVSSHTLN